MEARMMTEARKCYRKGGRRGLEQQWAPQAEFKGACSKRAKQFGAFAALRGYEEMLEQVREEVCTAESQK